MLVKQCLQSPGQITALDEREIQDIQAVFLKGLKSKYNIADSG